LGIQDAHRVEIRSPSYFPESHRASFVIPSISTAYRDRERDREKTAKIIDDIIENTPGNIAVFFPSFAYLEQVVPHVQHAGELVLQQKRGFSERERQQLLETMKRGEGHVLFAVMGGIFSEGVDLPDKALCCAVMVGPCLPQANYARRKIQEWNEERYQKGFAYAWLVPGMARVSQAAGRVIRTPTDKGTIILLGRRFASKSMQEFLPKELSLQTTRNIQNDLQTFWKVHLGN
jgi:DNA excision repair protein ERCC-2